MKKKTLSKSDIKQLNTELEKFNITLNKKDNVELIEETYYAINNNISLFLHDGHILPTLTYILKNPQALKQITVDMGAVRFVVNGADIMRPGITHIPDEIKKEEYVTIIDENNKKPLAIGSMLFDAQDSQNATEGKVIKNVHHVGDEIWTFSTKYIN